MPVPRIDDTAEPQTLDEIRAWHQGVADALVEQRASALRAASGSEPAAPRFVGMTEDEVHAHFEAHRRELDRLTMLNLVASAEAAIKVDFFRRVTGKLKDPLSAGYREWFNGLSGAKQLRPDFDEGGILDLLKHAGGMDNHLIGRFRECLPVRHWIGHGRFWARPVAVNRLDPDDVYSRAHALLEAMPD